MKKFLATLAVLTVVATPAIAQSFCTCDGTGPITLPQNAAIAAPQSGQNAFAMVSAPSSASNSDSPAAAGGGSLGYNEMLRSF